MCGIYAFTFLTGRVGRRMAFAVAYVLGLCATSWTFGFLSHGRDSYWIMPSWDSVFRVCSAVLLSIFQNYFRPGCAARESDFAITWLGI